MLRTFETEEDIYKKFKMLCDEEGVKIGQKINELMVFSIKQKADPQTRLNLNNDIKLFDSYEKWFHFIENIQKPEELRDYENKIYEIKTLIDKKVRHGTVRVFEY